MSQFNIEVKDTVFDPSHQDGKNSLDVHVRKRDSDYLYKVWIYLSGYDLPYVKSVSYELHKTFADQIREVKRTVSNPNCQLVIWTWGLFYVKVIITDTKDRRYHFTHRLRYDKELQQHQEKIEYIFD